MVLNHWEHSLIDTALKAYENHKPLRYKPARETEFLRRAHAHCEEITRLNSKTFFFASNLMPLEKRQAIRALYAFCRLCDDAVDTNSGEEAYHALQVWQAQSMDSSSNDTHWLLAAWHDTCQRYHIPRAYAEQLIQGVSEDLCYVRYQNFPDLANYCYHVASTVGLMSMHIIGYQGQQAIPYAIRLGVALQLTNILRDVGEDWRAGRLYLPLDELAAFGLSEADIERGVVTPQWREFMRFQIARARDLYQSSFPGIGLLNKDGRFAVAAAAVLYQHILDEIEANDYDVFNHRASTSKFQKLLAIPGILWRVQRLDNSIQEQS